MRSLCDKAKACNNQMAHLCLFTTVDLEFTWFGSTDDPERSRRELTAENPQREPLYWAVFFRQGHLLPLVVNALVDFHVDKAWYALIPEQAAHTICEVSEESLEGYRSWQRAFPPFKGDASMPDLEAGVKPET